jgi:hypothetical protein
MHKSLFDYITEKAKDSKKEVGMDIRFPMKSSAKDSLEKKSYVILQIKQPS